MLKKIILDCDPGIDDALNLLLAMASPQDFEILGITAVGGNVPLFLTQKNARKICELAGRPDIFVFAGCPRPMLRSLRTAEFIHGKTGMDGAVLPEPVMPLQTLHAVDFIIKTLMESTEKITLVPTGALTNLAIAIIKAPLILDKIDQIVLMGGSIAEGNITPAAEFNMYTDPHAAHVVFTSGIKITMLGLDVTHLAVASPSRIQRIRDLKNPVAQAVAGMLEFNKDFDINRYGKEGGHMHDPCVMAYLLKPDLFKGRQCHVHIETQSEHSMGRTLVDWWGMTGQIPNAFVINHMDVEGFFELVLEKLQFYA